MPLLPRSGYFTSTCSTKSLYFPSVTRLAPPLAFDSTPFTTLHSFVPPTLCRPVRSLPLNSRRGAAAQAGVACRNAGARTPWNGYAVPRGSVIVPYSVSFLNVPANCRSASPPSHCGGSAKRSVSFVNVRREIGRTLPTTPTNRPTSTPFPEECRESHDGNVRPSLVWSVRSQVPSTAGRLGACCAARGGIKERRTATALRAAAGGRSCGAAGPRCRARRAGWAPAARRGELLRKGEALRLGAQRAAGVRRAAGWTRAHPRRLVKSEQHGSQRDARVCQLDCQRHGATRDLPAIARRMVDAAVDRVGGDVVLARNVELSVRVWNDPLMHVAVGAADVDVGARVVGDERRVLAAPSAGEILLPDAGQLARTECDGQRREAER